MGPKEEGVMTNTMTEEEEAEEEGTTMTLEEDDTRITKKESVMTIVHSTKTKMVIYKTQKEQRTEVEEMC